MSYYDIHTILAEEEKLFAVFNVDSVNLGHLDSSCPDKDLKKGARLELPFWLSAEMSRRKLVRLEMPKYYNTKVRGSLAADAAVINLHDKNPYYYTLGLQLSKLLRDEELPTTLLRAFAQRYKSVVDRSLNVRSKNLVDYTRKLTQVEREIFHAGNQSSIEFDEWKNRRNGKLIASSIIEPTRKRKRVV